MCKANAQLLLDGQIIPLFNIFLNSFFAIAKRSSASLRRLRTMGGLGVVSIWYRTERFVSRGNPSGLEFF